MARPKGSKTALIQPRPQGPEESVEAPEVIAAPETQEADSPKERRERKRGSGPACPRCGVDDTFASGKKRQGRYPKHIEDRIRYYECGQCQYMFSI